MPLVPRSDHSTLREEVLATQRGRLMVGICDVVADKGYAAATVADVLAAAGVSRRTFYEHFADKEACFLAAYDYGVEAMRAPLAEAVLGAESWREAARIAVGTFFTLLAAEPGFARAFLIEIWTAGPEGLRRAIDVVERFRLLVRGIHDRARAEEPGLAVATDAQLAAISGGISRVATIEILEGRAETLPALTGEVVDFALAVLARPAA